MKKTVTTIFTLALAMILVSSLSSGVIYANGGGKHSEVVIFDCAPLTVVPFTFWVRNYDSSPDAPMITLPTLPAVTSCAETFAFLLNEKFKVKDLTHLGIITRYTMIKK